MNNVESSLDQLGYRRVTLNTSEIVLYYSEEAFDIYSVVLFQMPEGTEFSPSQVENILSQIKIDFAGKREKRGHVLPVFITADTARTRRSTNTSFGQGWILEETTGRLFVYDMPDAYYTPLRQLAERDIYGAPQARMPDTGSMNAGTQPGVSGTANTGRSYTYAPGTAPRRTCSYAPARPARQRIAHFSMMNSILILANIAVYLWLIIGGIDGVAFNRKISDGALYWPMIVEQKQYYRLFTYMFLHYGFSHIFNNMLVLGVIGDNLERAAGKVRYLIIYLGAGVLAGLTSVVWNMSQNQDVYCVGASGAIFGVVGAMAWILIVNRGRLEDLKLYQIILFVALSLYSGIVSEGVDNAAHIGGFAAGFLLAVLIYRRKKPDPVSRGYYT